MHHLLIKELLRNLGAKADTHSKSWFFSKLFFSSFFIYLQIINNWILELKNIICQLEFKGLNWSFYWSKNCKNKVGTAMIQQKTESEFFFIPFYFFIFFLEFVFFFLYSDSKHSNAWMEKTQMDITTPEFSRSTSNSVLNQNSATCLNFKMPFLFLFFSSEFQLIIISK